MYRNTSFSVGSYSRSLGKSSCINDRQTGSGTNTVIWRNISFLFYLTFHKPTSSTHYILDFFLSHFAPVLFLSAIGDIAARCSSPPKMTSSNPTTVRLNQIVETKLPAAISDKLPHLPESKDELKAEAEVVATKSLSGLRSLAAGGFGGICAVVVGHPFDLVKVRLQTAEKGVYTSAIDVVRKSVAKNGLARGLYAGVSAPLVGVTPMCKSSLRPPLLLP